MTGQNRGQIAVVVYNRTRFAACRNLLALVAVMKNLLHIDPSATAFMLLVSLVLNSYQPLHADTMFAADYSLQSEWADVIVVDPLIAPMDAASHLVHECAESGCPVVVWTALQPSAMPGCPVEIIAKENTLALAAWLEQHK